MHQVVASLWQKLSFGNNHSVGKEEIRSDTVSTIARVYEKARNALEYRADHLVRRAAIERMLRRQVLLYDNADQVATELMTELKWAKYISAIELEQGNANKLRGIIEKYWSFLHSSQVSGDWLTGVLSAEIDEIFTLNNDYQIFTNFAFQTIKQKVSSKVFEVENFDLVLFSAVDRVISQSDEAQVSYHILKLCHGDILSTYKLYKTSINHSLKNKTSGYVRSQQAPIVLLRDMYFYNPIRFREVMTNQDSFINYSHTVLIDQLKQTDSRIQTAAFRSVVYVFLTKMLVGLLLEIPVDKLLYGHLNYFALLINLLVPPLVMMLMAQNVSLPNSSEQKILSDKAWQIISDFDSLKNDRDLFRVYSQYGWSYYLFSGLYTIVFVAIFVVLFYVLSKLRISFVSQGLFVFFLCLVSFFAYRIRQIANLYYYNPTRRGGALGEMFMLPIVVVGGYLSRGISYLNVIAFVFDFILEAPIKILLRFLDHWAQFLSLKRDEVVG